VSTRTPIRIKFLSKTKAEDIPALWSPLIPRDGFEDVEFTFDVADRNYNFLVVYEGLPKWLNRKVIDRFESLACPQSNTLLITTEPSSIRIDGPHFMRQFGYVLTNKSAKLIRHPKQIQQTPPLRWFYGRPMDGTGEWLSHDTLSQSLPDKTADLSTVCSTKKMSHTIHAARLDFVMKLRERLKTLDVYGRGITPISDKAEAMRDYRYHIAIENHNDEFTKRQAFILEARQRVLTQHNTLGWVARFVRELNLTPTNHQEGRIYSRHSFRKRHPLKALSDLSFRTAAQFSSAAKPLQLSRPEKN